MSESGSERALLGPMSLRQLSAPFIPSMTSDMGGSGCDHRSVSCVKWMGKTSRALKRGTCPVTRIRQGKDVRMIVGDDRAHSADTINQPLVAVIAEAQELHHALIAAPQQSVASFADTLGRCRKRSAQLLRIAHLAPDIIAQCIGGI